MNVSCRIRFTRHFNCINTFSICVSVWVCFLCSGLYACFCSHSRRQHYARRFPPLTHIATEYSRASIQRVRIAYSVQQSLYTIRTHTADPFMREHVSHWHWHALSPPYSNTSNTNYRWLGSRTRINCIWCIAKLPNGCVAVSLCHRFVVMNSRSVWRTLANSIDSGLRNGNSVSISIVAEAEAIVAVSLGTPESISLENVQAHSEFIEYIN